MTEVLSMFITFSFCVVIEFLMLSIFYAIGLYLSNQNKAWAIISVKSDL